MPRGKRKLGKTARRILLALHLTCAAAWFGGIIALLLLSSSFRAPGSGDALAAARAAMKLVDYGVIIPACFGSLFTGVAFMAWTPWGFTRHWWVVAKWTSTLVMIAFGAAFLGPWVDASAAAASALGLGALTDSAYVTDAGRITFYASLQLGLLLGLLVLSSFKPWGRREIPRRGGATGTGSASSP